MTNSQSGDTNDGSTDDDEFVVVNPGGEHMSLSQKSIQKLKAWLNPTDSETPASEYRKHLNSHAKGTGEWILETDQYREWSQSNSVGNLWIRGIPGCGKSVVAAGLISRLRRAENGLVLFFFFREIIQANRTPRSLMQDFCHGMLDHSPWLQSELDQLQTQHSSVESVPYDKLWKCMATAMQSIGKVHCVVDALDEMEQGNDQFFKELLDLGRRSPASIKLIVTSRQVPHVEKHLNGISLVDLRLDRRNVDRDIAIYSAQRLEDTHLDLSLEKLEQVKQAICERGRGLFLYARLMLDQLLLQPQLMLANIENLPDGLGDMYTELLHDHAIRSGTSAIFQQIILQWITHSARPLRLLELFVMIDSLPDRAGLTQEQDAKLAIRTTCGPLLEVCEDGVVQIIHHSLTEFVLNRDVVHTQMSNQVREISGFHSPTIHGMITRVCINYLSNGCLDQWPTDPHTAAWKKDGKELMLRFYFLRYAVLEWPFHAANADESDDELLHLLDQFCQDGNQSYEAWKKIWPALQPNTIPSNCSPLDIAAYCGIFAFAKHLIGKRANTDSRNSKTNGLFPPLLHAIKKNHHRIVSLLLQHGANREKHDGRDPVFYATELNHVESLRALIEGGVDPKTTAGTADGSSEIIYCEFLDQEVSYSGWNKKRTPLACACHDGYIEAVQELIKHLDSAYLCKGYLHIAAEQGKSTVVKTLLQDEKVRLSINDKDSDGNTPLYLAAKSRDYATIQVLLDHGADISISSMNLNHPPEPPHTLAKYDRDGVWPNYSALHGLAFGARRVRWKKAPERSNWIKALKMLLSAGCDINARDHRGRTPLFWWSEFPAASDKYEATEFVATLLEYGANASLFDYEMSSPLHRSSTKLTPRMVELLVNGGVDLNSTRDSDGMTPLMFMASSLKNHEVSSWRDMKANFAQKDWAGNTAFHHCFCSLARALKENDTACWMNDWFAAADLGAQNHCGRTPFLEFLFRQPSIKFMDRDHIKVVQEFVKNGALLEGRDFSGRTALLTALDHPILRSLGIVEEILRLGGDVKATDNEGKSALHYAFRIYDGRAIDTKTMSEFIQRLIDLGANVYGIDRSGNTILHGLVSLNNSESEWWQLGNRAKKIVGLGVPVHLVNHQGRTALHLAARNRSAVRQKEEFEDGGLGFLLGPSVKIDPNIRDNEGRTALHFASAASDIYASTLIQHGADIWVKDHHNRTPLHFAAQAGQSNVVGLLLEHYEKERKLVDESCLKKRSALHEACRTGCQETVQLLLDAGANPRLQDRDGRTPLHAAAEFTYLTTARAKQSQYDSIDSGFKKSTVELNSWDAVSQKQVPAGNNYKNYGDLYRDIRQVVVLLIAAGANPHSTDKNGHTASNVATMLGCFPVSDELNHVVHCESNPSANLRELQLSPLVTWSHKTLESITVPEDHVPFLKNVVSTGDGRLLEGILRINQLKLTGKDGEEILSLVAHWGLASMMERLIPYVENFTYMICPLLEIAIRRELCNIQIVRVLAKEIRDMEDKSPLVSPMRLLAKGEHWWYPQALSVLLDAGADSNAGGYKPTLVQMCLDTKGGMILHEKWFVWRYKSLEILLKNGSDPNALEAAFKTKRDLKVLKLLIEHGASLEANSKLFLLAAIGQTRSLDFAAIEFLLESGADPNGTDSKRPLFEAASSGPERLVELLLKHGADPQRPMRDGSSTVLHEICGVDGIIKPILAMGTDLNSLDAQGRTPVMRACTSNRASNSRPLDAVILIQAGVCIDSVDSAGLSALHHAAQSGNSQAVKELLKRSVKLSSLDFAGFTPLSYALSGYALQRFEEESHIRPQFHATIEALLDAGADPHDVLPDGRMGLHCVAEPLMNYSNENRENQIRDDFGEDHFSAASRLYQRFVEAGCDPEHRDNKGRAPIFYFVAADKSYVGPTYEYGNESPFNPDDCCKMFAEHDIQKIDHDGDNLLHVLARREEGCCDSEDHVVKLFSMLVNMGLNPRQENKIGQTPLDIAATHDKPEILALFARED